MNRRELLQQVAWLMGGAVSAPAALAVLNGCTAKHTAAWQPLFLSQEEGAIVSEVAEIMIPRTDTPGARDVGVPAFIDVILKDAYPSRDQARFVTGLKEFDAAAASEHGKPFMELDAKGRAAFVQAVHDAAAAEERKLNPSPKEVQRPFILMMKELSLLGFFTSEVGVRQVLQYVAVPGGFQACIPTSQAGNGKTWAVETSLRF